MRDRLPHSRAVHSVATRVGFCEPAEGMIEECMRDCKKDNERLLFGLAAGHQGVEQIRCIPRRASNGLPVKPRVWVPAGCKLLAFVRAWRSTLQVRKVSFSSFTVPNAVQQIHRRLLVALKFRVLVANPK